MAKVTRIPLKERLMRAGRPSAVPCAAFELFVEDYYPALVKMCGDDHYLMGIFHDKIRPHIPPDGILLTEIIHLADGLPFEERFKLIYHVMIEPFAIMKRRDANDTAGHTERDL